jgi:hypothetical protein
MSKQILVSAAGYYDEVHHWEQGGTGETPTEYMIQEPKDMLDRLQIALENGEIEEAKLTITFIYEIIESIDWALHNA